MDEVEVAPSEMFSRLGMLVVESRVPHPSAKGRTDGPHCPSSPGDGPHHQCRPQSSPLVSTKFNPLITGLSAEVYITHSEFWERCVSFATTLLGGHFHFTTRNYRATMMPFITHLLSNRFCDQNLLKHQVGLVKFY